MSCGELTNCGEIVLRLVLIGISNGAMIALNAVGVTLVYGVVRMLNFAHGDLFALSTVLVTSTILQLGLQPELPVWLLLAWLLLLLLLAMGSGAALNVAIERVAFRPFRDRSRVAPLIATIGVSFMLYQGALFLRSVTNRVIPGEHRSVPGIPELPRVRIPDFLPNLNLTKFLQLPLSVPIKLKDLLIPLLAAGLALLVGWLLEHTRAGRALRACSQDPDMATLCGVDRQRTIRLAFAMGGALAGAAAWVFALYYTHPYTLYGAQSGLLAFTAAVLGGIGKPRGAFWSAMLLGVLAALSDFFLATQWTPVLLLVILIGLLVLKPTGLAGDQHDADGPSASLREAVAGFGRFARRDQWLLLGMGGLALLYPLLDHLFGWRLLVLVTGVLIFALLALGLNLLLGGAGLLDLGYAACFAIGAYVAGQLITPGGAVDRWLNGPPDFMLVLLISASAAGLFGALNGLLTRRVRGEYLAITTLAFGQMIPLIVLNIDQITGGTSGMAGLPAPRLLSYSLATPLERYLLVVLVVALVALASLRLLRSRVGRAWSAISEDEGAAASVGVNVVAARTVAFVVASAIAGSAGALFASVFSYIDPGQSELRVSILVLAMVVIGRAGSVPGAIIGAFVVAGYDQLGIPLLGSWIATQSQIVGWEWLGMFDLRSLNYLSFGLAIYLTVLLRSRQTVDSQLPTSDDHGSGVGKLRRNAVDS
jgi:branched-chain amino acid transport system permease protein